MKYLLLSILSLLFGSAFGQLQDVYFEMPGGNVQELPYLSNTVSAMDPFDCPYKQQTDSISGKLITVSNPLFDTTGGFRFHFQDINPYCYLSYPYGESFIDLPPFLDSLSDGTYVQYYDALPIRDADTVKWKNKIVAAVFELKNNQSIGEVRWYYPNGLLMQKGAYNNGLRTGEWFFQQTHEAYLSKKQKRWYSMSFVTTQYTDGKKNGIEYKYDEGYHQGKNPPVDEIWQAYQSDIPHGKYEHRINGQPRTTGEYNNGKPSGTWTQYQWKDSIEYGKLIPRLIYTYPTDSVTVHFPAHLRRDFEHRSLVKSDQFGTMDLSPITPLGYFSSSEPYTTNAIGQTFDSYYQIFNCSHCSPGYRFNPSYTPYYLDAYNSYVSDSLGKTHHIYKLADSCGVIFRFSGILEEYYPNGQLKLHFDFGHPETLLNNTVYWENGKAMNRFRKSAKGNDWEQLWYSKKGEIVEHMIYDSLFHFKSKPVDPDYVVLNGETYSKAGDQLSYNRRPLLLLSQNEPLLIEERRFAIDKKLISRFYFYPSTRTGFKALDMDKPYKHTRWFTFDSTFTYTHLIDTFIFGNLSSVLEMADSIKNDLWYQFHGPLNNDTINNDVLYFGDLTSTAKVRSINYEGKPYTGKLSIRFTNSAKPRISKTKNGLVLSLDRKTDAALLYTLFPKLSGIFLANNPSTITDKYIDKEILAALPGLELKVIEIQLSNGSVKGEVNCFGPNSRPLATLQYEGGVLSGRQVYYNNFPNTYRNFGPYNYYRNENDQTAENYKRIQVTQQVDFVGDMNNGTDLKMNLNGDTVYIHNYRDGKLDGEQFSADDYRTRNFFMYKNGGVVAERKEDARTRKTLMDWSSEAGIYRSYHKNGEIAQEIVRSDRQIYDTIRCYDTIGFLTKKLCLTNRILDFAIFYENGERSLTIDYAVEDTLVYPFSENDLIRYPITEEIMRHKAIYKPPLGDYQYTGYVRKYNQYNELEEEGMLSEGSKKGDWHYYQPQTNGHYCIHFSDSVEENYFYNLRTGSVTFFDPEGNVISKGELLNYSTEYSCLQRSYNEQFAINYELYHSVVPPDTLMPVVHYYKTGIKMNEGNLLNGQAHGLWRWYHSDGSLYGLGNYENGKRHGRWLEGDLSKVNFLGEYCLDPDKTDYTKLLSELEVTVIYYDHGKVTDVQNHQFRGTK